MSSDCSILQSRFTWVGLPLIVLFLSACGGCAQGEAKAGADETPETRKESIEESVDKSVEPDVILQEMIKAYQSATAYRDDATIKLTYNTDQGDQGSESRLSVALERPNKLNLERTAVKIVSDGTHVYGQPAGWDGQVVVTATPARIEVPNFYSIEPIAPLLQPGGEGNSIQLDLLAAKEPLKDVLDSDIKPKLLDPDSIESRKCQRVQQDTETGKVIFWIDEESRVLRRVEIITERVPPAWLAMGVKGQSVTWDFNDAELNGSIDAAEFQWPKSDDETLVRRLTQPPESRGAPHPMLGKAIPAVTLTTSNGETIATDELKGKISVIDFWATWCPPCLRSMPKLQKTYEKYVDSDDVRFLALSMDAPNVTNTTVTKTLDDIGVKVPWARIADSDNFEQSAGKLKIEALPAYGILDKKGVFQFVHVGGDLNLPVEVPRIIKQLMAGDDLVAEAKEAWEQIRKDYRKQIDSLKIDNASQVIEIPRAEVKSRSDPKQFVLTQLWTSKTDLQSPGNLLVIPSGTGKPNILTIEQYRTIVELDTEGKQVAKHDNILPDGDFISFMRAFTNKEGSRFLVVGTPGRPQFHVFNDQWQLKLTYPNSDKSQIFDVMPGDLDGDGHTELCVGYFGEVGVQCVSLDGRRIWKNRSIVNVSDLAVGRPDNDGNRLLYCTHLSNVGALAVINGQGQAQTPIEVPGMAITRIQGAELGAEGQLDLCALAMDGSQQRWALGLGPTGEVIWRHKLPTAVHETPIDPLIAGKISANGPGHWFYAAADGSIHIMSADGQKFDQFNTGQKLTGLAITEFDGKTVLLVSSNEGVTAWRITGKDA